MERIKAEWSCRRARALDKKRSAYTDRHSRLKWLLHDNISLKYFTLRNMSSFLLNLSCQSSISDRFIIQTNIRYGELKYPRQIQTVTFAKFSSKRNKLKSVFMPVKLYFCFPKLVDGCSAAGEVFWLYQPHLSDVVMDEARKPLRRRTRLPNKNFLHSY